MTANTFYSYVDGPLGRIFVQGDGQFVTGLYLPDHKGWHGPDPAWQQVDAPFAAVREQLGEYFAGERQAFDLRLKLTGTPFQQRVWQELVRIPFGTTITYAQLAQRVGKPTASRAVGHANGRNPISIIVPCHRVIGADGKLVGYGGGMDKKQWLLTWERRAMVAEPGEFLRPRAFVPTACPTAAYRASRQPPRRLRASVTSPEAAYVAPPEATSARRSDAHFAKATRCFSG